VIVNRLWHYHFGRGIVATTNDFGSQGRPPTHPGLLDWLAGYLVEHGWRLKQVHRLLLTSATYRQRSVHPASPAARKIDPGNNLLWRMRIHRLDAEQARDAMLAVSGELDKTMGGEGDRDESPRRTIYLRVMRNQPEAMLAAFDGPDNFSSCARRVTTTTAPQALLMINGPWSIDRGRAMANRLLGRGLSLDEAIEGAYRLALCRPPTESQRSESRTFVRNQIGQLRQDAASTDPDKHFAVSTEHDDELTLEALADLCHVLLNSNEFLYVD